MLNALTNAKTLALLLFIVINVNANSSDSIPIAEYCVVYEKKGFCDCEADSYVFANVYLRLENILQEQDDIVFCTYSKDYDFYWIRKFLIHDDLKVEQGREGINIGYNATLQARRYTYITTVAEWDFISEIPIYAKNGKQFNFNKYYEKGKIIPVEWELKTKCSPFYNAVYSGKYYIRITGECKNKIIKDEK